MGRTIIYGAFEVAWILATYYVIDKAIQEPENRKRYYFWIAFGVFGCIRILAVMLGV